MHSVWAEGGGGVEEAGAWVVVEEGRAADAAVAGGSAVGGHGGAQAAQHFTPALMCPLPARWHQKTRRAMLRGRFRWASDGALLHLNAYRRVLSTVTV